MKGHQITLIEWKGSWKPEVDSEIQVSVVRVSPITGHSDRTENIVRRLRQAHKCYKVEIGIVNSKMIVKGCGK